MDLFKLFNRRTSETVRHQDDLVECDDICQLLIELTKLVADVKDENKVSKFLYDNEEEFDLLSVNIENLTIIIPKVFEIIDNFDFRDVKFSGYRSFFSIIKKCIQKVSSSLRKTLRFQLNKTQIQNQWYDYCQCLNQLTVVAKVLYQMMLAKKDSKSLFLSKTDDEEIYTKMMESYNNFFSEPFYGQCLGFYLCESCLVMAKVLCSVQLGLGQAVSVPKSDLEVFVATVINGTHSLFLENKRGAQMSNLFKQATVTFCKQFWNLVDHPILIRWSHLVLPHLKVIKQITLQPIDIHMPLSDNSDEVIIVNPPGADNEYTEVNIRLLSSKLREGMDWSRETVTDKVTEPPSKCILIHCHGGGFVAQSSQSHDGYLRQWAIDLDCPIVSVDYSHAPKHPFPKAHEECFYTYCWVLKNLQQFGCEPDCRVVICGDSAGGNLALGCVVRALKLNIRLPDGLFVAYPAALVDFIPSPARILGVIDPILPLGVLARCLLAYVGVDEDTLVKSMSSSTEVSVAIEEEETDITSKKKKASFLDRNAFDAKGVRLFYSKQDVISPLQLLEKANIKKDPIMSPLLSDDDFFRRFPPTSVVASEFDPLMDDSVELCKKIDAAGGQFVQLQVMPNLPHGFLSMSSPVTRECAAANKICVEEIRKLLAGIYQ